MTSIQFRLEVVGEEVRFAVEETSLGNLLVAATKKEGVVCILLGDDPEELVCELRRQFPTATLIGDDVEYQALVARLIGSAH